MKRLIVVWALTLLGVADTSFALSMEDCEKFVSDLETEKAMSCLDVQRKLASLELIDSYQDKLKALPKKDRSNLVAAQKSWESTLKSCASELLIEKESDYINVLLCEISKIRGRRIEIKASN
jgi:uncharacterized protein YecT (DUF1311 family)